MATGIPTAALAAAVVVLVTQTLEASTAVSVAAGAVAFAGPWACCSFSSAGPSGPSRGAAPRFPSPDRP
jgi:hypothetical protein